MHHLNFWVQHHQVFATNINHTLSKTTNKLQTSNKSLILNLQLFKSSVRDRDNAPKQIKGYAPRIHILI